MALLTLLFGSGKGTTFERTVGGKTSSLTLDATLKEDFTAESEPTENPIEDGSTVTDHIILKPNKLNIAGVITETPMNAGSQISGAVTTAASTIGNKIAGSLGGTVAALGANKIVKSLSSVLGAKDRQLSDVVKEFVEMRDAKQLVTIQTGLTQYKDYVLKSFNASRDSKTGRSINVALSFQQVLIVQNKTIEIPNFKAALGTKNDGRKTATAVDGEKGRKSSIAYDLFIK